MSLRPRPAGEVPESTVRVARAAFPKGCLAMRVRDELGPLFEDEQFAEVFPARGGPGLSPGMLALVSVLQFAEGLSDRQAADAVRGRIDWKYGLALELTDPGFDFSVLSEFRDRLIRGGIEHRMLETVLERCSRLGLLRAGGRQRTDSTHILAAVRTLNRMEFVGETLRCALEALAAAAPDWLAERISSDVVKRYGARVDAYRFPTGADARTRWAQAVGADGFALLEAIYAPTAPAWLQQIPAVQILRVAWVQQYHRDDKGVRWREAGDLPPGRARLSSPYDPDAHYGVKRGSGWCGYKVHLSETCDEEGPHLITHVATTNACTGDIEMTPLVHTALERRGLLPGEHVVDAGYISAALIVSAQSAYDVDLLGPVGADTTGQIRTQAGVAQEDFTVDWDGHRVICPRGAISISWSDQRKSNGTAITQVRFSGTDCDPCPIRGQCTRSAGGTYGRTLTLLTRPLQQVLDARRREQQTQEWKDRYAIRAGIEATISQAVRGTAIRRTRYLGLPKTALGHVFTATAINLIRLDAWWTGTPRGPTRVSHLTRLATDLGLAA
ncbi:IS1182 family transposase [Streptosporangium subroseum]|uniref:IS1182 family transposase n=1 Tax=Streptosporangium subroseum TaxID=106412 RepID=UPI003443F473